MGEGERKAVAVAARPRVVISAVQGEVPVRAQADIVVVEIQGLDASPHQQS